ncbi:hypothetical protein TI04_08960 [Achromatium sp. WMS2]|nr:hypothetical protein TI04_08960 [Achromatium sp. WMS2]
MYHTIFFLVETKKIAIHHDGLRWIRIAKNMFYKNQLKKWLNTLYFGLNLNYILFLVICVTKKFIVVYNNW